MAVSAQLRLHVPVDAARDAVASVLAEQGFVVRPTPTGALDVERGSLGTTLVAGAFAGQDMHVQFTVTFAPTAQGAAADFDHSSVGGFFKGGAIGAAKASDVVREAAHHAGARLAQLGLLEGSVAAAPVAPVAPAVPVGAGAPAAYPGAQGYPGAQAYPGAAGPAIPPPIDYRGRTNVVSIFALVLAFVVPVGGVVAGSVALAQIKRTGEKGKGLAISAIIVAAGLIVAIVIALGSFFVFAAVSSTSSEGGSQTTDIFSVELGDCVNEVDDDVVYDVEVVDCALPHDYELYNEFDIPGDVYPGSSDIDAAGDQGCYDAYAAFVGVSYEESTLSYFFLPPSEESWDAGDRTVLCFIAESSGQTTGSLEGSAR